MPDHSRLTHRGALLLALLVTFLWSSSWVLIRWGLDDSLNPITFASLRYGLAALLLVAYVSSQKHMRTGVSRLNRKSALQIVFLGLVLYAVTQGAQFVAIAVQPAATTSVVLSWTPLLIGLVGGWSIAEGSSRRQLLGAGLVALGAWLFFAGDLGATAAGMVAALIALAGNTTSSLLGRIVNRGATTSPVVITALSMAVGAVVLIIVGLAVEGLPTLTPKSWLIVIWLAVVNTAVAFSLWNLTLRRLSAIESAVINNTMLIQIAILAWIFLGESLGLSDGVGILIVSLGVLLAQVQPRRRAGPASGNRP